MPCGCESPPPPELPRASSLPPKATAPTASRWPTHRPTQFPTIASQIRTVLSLEADAMREPLRDTSTQSTTSECPVRSRQPIDPNSNRRICSELVATASCAGAVPDALPPSVAAEEGGFATNLRSVISSL
eukprot:scaffold92551_cov32-Tisochrysis_lutea.AAC.4